MTCHLIVPVPLTGLLSLLSLWPSIPLLWVSLSLLPQKNKIHGRGVPVSSSKNFPRNPKPPFYSRAPAFGARHTTVALVKFEFVCGAISGFRTFETTSCRFFDSATPAPFICLQGGPPSLHCFWVVQPSPVAHDSRSNGVHAYHL